MRGPSQYRLTADEGVLVTEVVSKLEVFRRVGSDVQMPAVDELRVSAVKEQLSEIVSANHLRISDLH